MEGSSRSRQIPQRSFRPSHFRIRNRGSSLNSILLPETFHQDPADRLIVATARSLKIPLATQDRKIITSRLTRIWK
jgi:PIN domain nuclease of toxin-antitoxin system